MKSIEKNSTANDTDDSEDKTLEEISSAMKQHNAKRKQPLLTIFGSEDDGELSDNNQLSYEDCFENNNEKQSAYIDKFSNIKVKHHPNDESENFFDENPLNRRWLLLMEPINALHIAVILGAKVEFL